MADRDLTSPLLSSPPPSGQPEFIINVHGDDSRYGQRLTNDSQNRDQRDSRNSDRYDSRNPYDFLGSRELSVPRPITIDPFRNATPKIDGLYEVLKIVLCLPIALLRLILFGLSLAIGYIATWLALKGWKDKENPMPKWRCWIMWVTRFSARCILFSFGYQWIRRKGKPAPRKIAPIVVSNHVSYIEPIFYFYELFPTIVASESHDSMPFVGTIIRAMQVIYVNRFSQASRKNAVNEIKRKAASDRFPRVLLFPEGTTSNGKVLISFQLGAFIHGYPIQPVVVRYPHVHFDQSWGNVSLLMLMFRMFTQFHNFMEIEYLPVIFPSANKKESAVHFAERTSRAIATALNVVQTSHSYGDVLLLTRALELKLENPNNYTVEMATLCNVSSLEAVEFLDVFVSMNPDSRGRVTLHGFLRALRLKPCAVSEAIFRFIDVEKTGSITFKQFLFGSAHILKQPLFPQACELAFSESDANGDGFVSEQELEASVRRAIPDMNEDEVHGLFDLLDADRDRNISHNDFLSSLRRNPFLIAVFAPRNIQQELVQCIS